MKYETPAPITQEEARRLLDSGDQRCVQDALLRASLCLDDWQWVQQQALRFVDHPDSWTARNAWLALIHLVRLHKQLHIEPVLPALERGAARNDLSDEIADFAGQVEAHLGVRLVDRPGDDLTELVHGYHSLGVAWELMIGATTEGVFDGAQLEGMLLAVERGSTYSRGPLHIAPRWPLVEIRLHERSAVCSSTELQAALDDVLERLLARYSADGLP